MPDIENVLARIHRRGPCLVEVARALRPEGGERHYVWSSGGLGVCVEIDGARFERAGGPMDSGEAPLLAVGELRALAEALRWWRSARDAWWHIGTAHWGNWMSPTVKDVVQAPGEEARAFSVRGHREPSPYLRGAKVAGVLEVPEVIAAGVVVSAWETWRTDGMETLIVPRDAHEVVLPPAGARTGAELRLGEGLVCRVDRHRCQVSRGVASVTLLPDEDGVVDALLELLASS